MKEVSSTEAKQRKEFSRLLKNIKLFSKKKLSSVRTRLLSYPNRFGKKDYRLDLIEEMQGIADGASVGFITILTLNCRSEIMFAKAKLGEGSCTAIGVPPEASAQTYLDQNWA